LIAEGSQQLQSRKNRLHGPSIFTLVSPSKNHRGSPYFPDEHPDDIPNYLHDNWLMDVNGISIHLHDHDLLNHGS